MNKNTVFKKEYILKTFDNLELYCIKNCVKNSKAIVIIVHGLCEHSGRYEEVTSFLNKNQFTVYRYDLRGHGKSGGKNAYLKDFKNLSKDLHFVCEFVKWQNPDRKVFVLGHSMGGFSALIYGIIYKDKIDGIILSSAFSYNGNKDIRWMGVFLPKHIYLRSNSRTVNYNKFCHDVKVIERYKKDPLIRHKVGIGLIRELFKGAVFVKENINDFKYDTLILHGKGDKLINYKDSVNVFTNISSKNKKIILYNELYHEILNEKQNKVIYEDILKWIDKILNK